MKSTVLALLVFLSTTAATQGNVSKELEPFQGRWLLMSAGGMTQKPQRNEGMTFAGDKYQDFGYGEFNDRGTIKVNAKKNPMWIDFLIAVGDDAGKKRLGLVEFTADTMTLSLADVGDKDRPRAMDRNTLILKRIR